MQNTIHSYAQIIIIITLYQIGTKKIIIIFTVYHTCYFYSSSTLTYSTSLPYFHRARCFFFFCSFILRLFSLVRFGFGLGFLSSISFFLFFFNAGHLLSMLCLSNRHTNTNTITSQLIMGNSFR